MTTRRRARREWVQNLARPQVREPIRMQATKTRAAAEHTGTAADWADFEADLFIYDYIDSDGGIWGISALEVVTLLNEVQGGTVNVRLNSPGGCYFEGVAILNALLRHPATVNVYVDGLAASAASVIAMAGKKRVMGLGAQLMIHEASTICPGTARDMRKTAEMLDQTNDDIAELYAGCMGKDVDAVAIRAQLAEETWFTAATAVECGLATELAKKADPDDDEDDEPDEEDDEGEKAPPFKKKNEAPDWATDLVAAVAGLRSDVGTWTSISIPVSRETAPQAPAGTPPAESPAPLPSAGFTWSEALVSALTERRSS